jgi:NAD(P)-dependent dehydrogenase (short-subunit alcohol dehydrogenase family)
MANILVTGGGTGIGLKIALSFAESGSNTVVIAGRRGDVLNAACSANPPLRSVRLDVTSEASVKAAFTNLAEDNLSPDILINCAGAAITAPFHKTTVETWQAMLDVNLTGCFLTTQAALPHMKKQGFGRIINIASTAGLKGYAYTAAYTAAKHGVVGMTKALALELAGTGITANTVCPGFTDTDIVQNSIKNIVEKTGRSEAEALAELTKHNPEGRLIRPEEVADTVLWLAGKNAASINGQAIAIAGGEVM